ncbi:hypothetical protein J3459_022304 [Metarhizium acridum]|uniref:uncharacterized protein n=1 Tax=Metarhizium acridum TaxID=92637 RepID=UPI001C6BC21A|nr:hypothetical protein J3459_022304 [Metarhizium acridum]KAG8412798.1 hypothetical protein J3458_013233 [Metarhizium acridum]
MARISDEYDDQRRLKRYTIALCAVKLEMSAVRYTLDQEHRGYKQQDDPTIYILGELSGQNVILACLLSNQGKGAAASVATNVARTFPWICRKGHKGWRFMIGIGGGVPSERHDIRLGDVVISMPQGEHGGVVQYDLGRLTEDALERKGFLCPPPADLRRAVVTMKSNHVGQDNKNDKTVSAITQKSTSPQDLHTPVARV